MFRRKRPIALALLIGAALLVGSRLTADDKPKFETDNKNTLVKKHKEKIEVTASSTFQGFGTENLLDGDTATSWFSDSNDSVGKGKEPWVTVTFPEDVTVTRVTIAGNRHPDYPDDYSVLSGTLVFLDAAGKKIAGGIEDAKGKGYDFDFKPKDAVKKVRSIKFIPVKDQGDKNGYGDIALGEIMIE